MIITISGKPGSGKSTIAKMLATKLGYKHHSIGDLKRKWADSKGMTLAEYNKFEEKNPKSDNDADNYLAELGKKEDDFVIDARLGFHFIPQSFKVFLDVEEEEGAQRIRKDTRATEKILNLTDAISAYRRRQASDTARYQEYYKLDPFDTTHYDLVVDTTNMTPENVLDTVLSKLPNNNLFKLKINSKGHGKK